MSHEQGLNAINWWAWDAHRSPMGWFLLDFALFLALLVYFTRKPLKAALRERHQGVRKAVTQAAQGHAKATGDQQAWAQKLAQLDAEIKQMEAQSQADGEAEVAQLLRDAQARAEEVRQDAALQTEQELRRAHESVRQQMLKEVLALAEQMVVQAMTDGDQKELIDRATAALPKLAEAQGRTRTTMGRPS